MKAARQGPRGIEMVDVAVKDGDGKLLPDAIPVVTISADGSYSGMDYGHDTAPEIDLIASIEHKLGLGLLTGFVIQGLVPYGRTPSHTRNKLMLKATFSGIPVAKAGRGAPMGFADPTDFQIAADQSHREQGSVPADGLPAEVWQPAGGERSRQADKRRAGRHPQGRRRLSGGLRYALIAAGGEGSDHELPPPHRRALQPRDREIHQRRHDRQDRDRGHHDIHLEDLAAVLNEIAKAVGGRLEFADHDADQ